MTHQKGWSKQQLQANGKWRLPEIDMNVGLNAIELPDSASASRVSFWCYKYNNQYKVYGVKGLVVKSE